MRWLMSTTLLLMAACAPATQSAIQTPADMPARVDSRGNGYDFRLNAAGEALGNVFAAPVDKVWPLAVDAYGRVGLKIDASDPVGHKLQTRGQVVRRHLNGRALSTYFDCGSDITGTLADVWRLKIDAQMAVAPGMTADSARVATLLTVTATPVEGTSTTVTPCQSKGQLEGMIARLVADGLAGH